MSWGRRTARMLACKNCGALVDPGTTVCPVCGGTDFTDVWDGLIIIIDPDSELAKEIGIEKPGIYAIKVAGRVAGRKR